MIYTHIDYKTINVDMQKLKNYICFVVLLCAPMIFGECMCISRFVKDITYYSFKFTNIFPPLFYLEQMKSKKDAEEMEARLLDAFDYAWNRGSNGARRPNDIHQKLDCYTSSAWSHPIVRKLQIYCQRKVGLRIKTCENESSFYSNQESNSIFSRIFKFGKSRPILVSVTCDVNEDNSNICGVALGQGSVCIRPPVEGRKRCSEHKGMKVNGSTLKLKVNSQMIYSGRVPVFASDPGSLKLQPGKCPVNEDLSSTCGIALNDGSLCTRKPVRGRKRCEEHKGRKNHGSISKPVKEVKKHCVDVPSLEPRSLRDSSELLFSGTHKLQSSDFTERTSVNKDYGICGGLVIMENVPCINEDAFTCGSRTLDGTFCRRKPVKGSKWCWQHQGKRVDRVSKVGACNE